MFWRFNYVSTEINSLLDKEDVKLLEIISEDDVLQECKGQNTKLVDFLTKPENMSDLIDMIIKEPTNYVEEKLRFKYPNISCELITSDVNAITDALITNEDLLNKLITYLTTPSPLNPLQASFFSKVIGLLITRKSQLILDYLKRLEDFLKSLLNHFETSAIMDLLLCLIMNMENVECKTACIEWYKEQKVIERLITLLSPANSPEVHSNVAQSICDLIRHGRSQMQYEQDSTKTDVLLNIIQLESTISSLLENILSDTSVESSLVSGISIIHTLLEYKRIGSEGQMEPASATEMEKLNEGNRGVISALVPRLKDFNKILLQPPPQHYVPMSTTSGMINLPLGNTRLQIIRLIYQLLNTKSQMVYQELAQIGTLGIILDLFFEYQWNNFLHTQVEYCITSIMTESNNNVIIPSEEEIQNLVNQLISNFKLVEKIIDAFDKNKDELSKTGGRRLGFMGHLTKICNCLNDENYAQKILDILKGLSPEALDNWIHFISTTLAEVNKVNTTELAGGSVSSHLSITDNDFRLDFQQENSDHKYGYTEEDFNDQEDIDLTLKDSFSWTSSSPTSTKNRTNAENLFEDVCSDRISNEETFEQHTDSNSLTISQLSSSFLSNETIDEITTTNKQPTDEEIWQEKLVNFPASLLTPSDVFNNKDYDHNELTLESWVKSSDAHNSSDKSQETSKNPITMDFTNNEEWPKLINEEVSMEIASVEQSPWKTATNGKYSPEDSENYNETGWANFDSVQSTNSDNSSWPAFSDAPISTDSINHVKMDFLNHDCKLVENLLSSLAASSADIITTTSIIEGTSVDDQLVASDPV